MKVEETLPSALGGERLDRIVSLIADISRADASKLIADGGAVVDGAFDAGCDVLLGDDQDD